MERAGFQLTRYADDWLIVCRTRAEAERALASACAVLEGELGLRVHPEKTRIVHVSQGFEFLGYKIGLGRVCVSSRAVVACATNLGLAVQTLAQRRMANSAGDASLRRVRAGQPSATDSQHA